MPVLRCPACSKPNPDFLDKCQFCDTPLKAEAAGAPASAEDTLISPPADPLARLRSTQTFEPSADTPEAESGAAPEPPAEPETPSWMSRLRGVGAASPSDETSVPRNRVDEAAPDWLLTAPAGAEADELPAWMREEPPPPADAPQTGTAEDDLPDWLKNLRTSSSTPPAPPAPPAPALPSPTPPQADDDDLPVWLKIDQPAPRPGLAERPKTPPAPPAEMGTVVPPAPPPPAVDIASFQPPTSEPPTEPATSVLSEPPAAEAGASQPTDQTLVPPGRTRRKKMTDWLTPPEGGLPPQTPAPMPAEPEAELPDWLKAMQPTEEVPDWLKDVAAAPRVFNRPVNPPEAPQPPAAESPAPAADLGLPDWLKAVTPSEPVFPPPEPPAAEAPAVAPATDEDLPDWLKALRASPAPEAEPTVAEAHPARREQDLPDWLKAATGILPAAPAAEPPAMESPVREAEPEASAAVDESPAEASASAPEATAATPPSAPAVEPPAADVTLPWLAVVAGDEQAVADEPAAADEPPAAQPGDYELPDWLRPSPEALAEAEAELAAVPPPDSAAISAAELAAAEEALPDWLRNLQAQAGAEETLAEAEPAAPAPEADVPTWLRPAGLPASPPEPAETLPVDEVPDWLQTLQAQTADSPTLPTAEQAADLPPLDDETLAWLNASASAHTDEPALDPLAGAAEAPAWLEEFRAASEVPSPTAMDAVPAADDVEAAQPTAEEEMPDWLKALRGVPTQEQQAAEAMPDWLRALRGIPPRPVTEISPAPEAPALPEAEPATAEVEASPQGEAEQPVPEWLSAMRPTNVEHPADAEVDSYEENVGVLAGMRGVLRAEPTVAQPHRSSAPVQQLVVADSHAKQAKLLADLLAEEEAARPVSAPAPRAVLRYAERWLVFLVLAAAVLVPQFVLPGLFGAPATLRPEVQAAFNVVDAAPQGQPALVAFDYDPAQQGELSPSAVAVITHLMSRGVPVVAASTRPMGAGVAHAVLEQVAADLGTRAQVSYTYGSQYLNLGYIPGGPVGLLQFAAAPQSVFAADYTGAGPASALWTQPILREVDALADFSVVVLIAAEADDMRVWLEQGQAYAASVPHVALVSAGAEPMVRPYLAGEGAPLAGLVPGLAGAAQYEQYAGLPGTASQNWGGLGGGLWVAALLIAGGNAVYAAAAALRRRRR